MQVCQEPLEIKEPVRLHEPLEFFEPFEIKDLPQELVHEIFEYVPEYGYRVCRDLHELFLRSSEISVYREFLHYCIKRSMMSSGSNDPTGPIKICVQILDQSNPKDLEDNAINYLSKNLHDLVSAYLDDPSLMSCDVFNYFGVSNVDHFSDMNYDCHNADELYKNIEWRAKVIGLYSSMILRDSGLMTKKEFDDKYQDDDNLAIILEIVFGVFPTYEHIYSSAIRYFASETIMQDTLRRLETSSAVKDDIVYENNYCHDCHSLSQYMIFQEDAQNMDHSSLRKVRDKLLSVVPRDAYHAPESKYDTDFRQVIFMIQSMADEE